MLVFLFLMMLAMASARASGGSLCCRSRTTSRPLRKCLLHFSRHLSVSAAAGKEADDTSSEEAIREIRQQKVEQIRQDGHEPFKYSFARTCSLSKLHASYSHLSPGEEDGGGEVAVAGRVVAKRVFGKLAFVTLRDDGGSIQLFCEKRRLADFSSLKSLIDIGDFLGAKGPMKKTDKGELSVAAQEFQVLSKSLLPIPEKQGLSDTEARVRQVLHYSVFSE